MLMEAMLLNKTKFSVIYVITARIRVFIFILTIYQYTAEQSIVLQGLDATLE